MNRRPASAASSRPGSTPSSTSGRPTRYSLRTNRSRRWADPASRAAPKPRNTAAWGLIFPMRWPLPRPLGAAGAPLSHPANAPDTSDTRAKAPLPLHATAMNHDHFQHLLVRRGHDVLFAPLNHPETRNALAPGMVAELAQVVGWAESDAAVRALVLRGAQGFFCAGGDVGSFQARCEAQAGAQDPVAARNREFGHFMQRLSALPVPVIAAVEGAAIGGGMGLACACDLVLATADAKFALSETSLGLIPAQIAPFVVARLGLRTA